MRNQRGVIAYEIAHELEAIDQLREVLVTTIPTLSDDGRALSQNIGADLQRGSLKNLVRAEELTSYSNQVNSALDAAQQITKKMSDYEYMRRIFGGYDAFNPYEVVSSARNLAKTLREIPPGGPREVYGSILNNQFLISFDRSTIELRNWAGRVDAALGATRKQVLSIPAIPSNN